MKCILCLEPPSATTIKFLIRSWLTPELTDNTDTINALSVGSIEKIGLSWSKPTGLCQEREESIIQFFFFAVTIFSILFQSDFQRSGRPLFQCLSFSFTTGRRNIGKHKELTTSYESKVDMRNISLSICIYSFLKYDHLALQLITPSPQLLD